MQCEWCDREDAEVVVDPYDFELYGEENEITLCRECEDKRRSDV